MAIELVRQQQVLSHFGGVEMVVKRSLWQEKFVELPPWQCSTCEAGSLRATGSKISEEPVYSQAEHKELHWEPEFTVKRFCATMCCQNSTCGEVFLAIGDIQVRSAPDEFSDQEDYFELYVPKFIHPALNLFNIPGEVPLNIDREIRAAFGLFWTNKPAAIGRLRAALELVLDNLRIPRRTLSNKRRFVRISLHDRIIGFKNKEPELGKKLLALKWFGNEGVHTSADAISATGPEDMFDVFDILEDVLIKLYDTNKLRLDRATNRLIQRKGRPMIGRISKKARARHNNTP